MSEQIVTQPDSGILSVIASTHEYLSRQHEGTDDATYKVVMASQAQTLRRRIEKERGISTDDANTMLEEIRNGPWSGAQIHNLNKSINAAVDKSNGANASPDRKPQSCDTIETFFTARLWEDAMDVSMDRKARMARIVDFYMKMDLTNPDPKLKARSVAIMSLGDPWISASTVNAKIALDDFTDVLTKLRTPKALSHPRAHLTSFPPNPALASESIDGFAARVYCGVDHEGPSDDPHTTLATSMYMLAMRCSVGRTKEFDQNLGQLCLYQVPLADRVPRSKVHTSVSRLVRCPS